MRVRFTERMNARYALYLFRSIIFQNQINREARGTSLPNIFPAQVAQMLVPTCVLNRQRLLAAEIDAELTKRDRGLAVIDNMRIEMTDLIGEAIRALSGEGRGAE